MGCSFGFEPLDSISSSTCSVEDYDVESVIKIQRCIRQWLAYRRSLRGVVERYAESSASLNMRKRMKKLQEIVDSERSYVRSLFLAVKIFIEPFNEASRVSNCAAISHHEFHDIFHTLDIIAGLNLEFLIYSITLFISL